MTSPDLRATSPDLRTISTDLTRRAEAQDCPDSEWMRDGAALAAMFDTADLALQAAPGARTTSPLISLISG